METKIPLKKKKKRKQNKRTDNTVKKQYINTA